MCKNIIKKVFLSFLVIALALEFISCKKTESSRINLFNKLEICPIDGSITAEDYFNNPDSFDFVPFTKPGINNIAEAVGYDEKYCFLRVVFTLPENLKDKELALFENYLVFADETYINGNFAGSYGRFPPNELSGSYSVHFYHLTKNLLNQDGENTILIKILSHGCGEIGSRLVIGEYNDVENLYDLWQFHQSTIYLLIDGGIVALFVVFLILFLGQRKRKEYLYYSLMNLFSACFASVVFAPLVPWYKNYHISFLGFYKLFVCCGLYFVCFFLPMFVEEYLDSREHRTIHIVRASSLITQLFVTHVCKNISQLTAITDSMLALCILQLIPSWIIIGQVLFGKDARKRRSAITLIIGFLPLMITLAIDLIIKLGIGITEYPYFCFFGWAITLLAYLVVLSVRFSNTTRTSEYLNKNLQMEVEARTQEIKITNEKMESELVRYNADMDMAAIVQKRTFQKPTNNFVGWDIAVTYNALSKVSGDMYDFYSIGHMLDGFSIFDVSGHGIAASLITMLSKSIIFRSFRRSRSENIKSSQIMSDINRNIVAAKGDADNYMTGLMFQISPSNEDASCQIQFANGGHPHPILYSVKENKTEALLSANAVNQYGAIGFKDIEASFQDVDFTMYVGDILVSYTDGLIEALNMSGKQFGKENVIRIIQAHHEETADEILEAITSGLKAYTAGMKMEDDLTVIVMKRQHPKDFLEEI